MRKKTLILFFFALCAFNWVLAQETQPKKPKKHLELKFSLNGGHYEHAVTLELSSPGAKIFYTLDGNNPSKYTIPYIGSLTISETTVVRAIAYKGKKKSKLKTQTYFIAEAASTFPYISIAIPPEELFDPDEGLFVEGNMQDSTWKKTDANFWSRSETKINFEFFETDGKSEFNSITGFRLFGGMSRLFPQKSMAIVARDRLGKKWIKHKIFGKKGAKKFKFLVLRNSGSDFGRTHFRDGLMTDLVSDWDIEKQDYRPSHVYINGKYWGIYNIREKINRYFINTYHNIDKDSIDLIEHRMSLKRGALTHYTDMLHFMKDNDLADPDHFRTVESMMEVDNYMDYQILQMYINNRDAGGNIKFWRPQTPTGRWRWILYDTDWGMGLHDSKAYKKNSLLFYTEDDGPSWPNPPWSTFILRNLLKNKSFRKKLVNRFADHLNETFEISRVLEKINHCKSDLVPEIGRHFDRWRLGKKRWNGHIDRMRDFAIQRPEYMRMHIQSFFDAGEIVGVSIGSNQGGKVVLNDHIHIKNRVFTGKYFEAIPLEVKAIPNFGYRFLHWIYEGREITSTEFDLKLKGKNDLDLKAVFEKSTHPLTEKVLINEVSCNNSETGDWVELYNATAEVVDLTDWYFSDKKHYFRLPFCQIQPKEHVILCEDTTIFRQTFPEIKNLIGNLGFGLNKRKEVLGLYSEAGASIDSLAYKVEPMDTFFTLGLLLPHLDNADPENWEINVGTGTPDRPNPFFLESRIKAEQDIWIRIGIGVGIFLCALLILKMRTRKYPQG